MNLPIRINPASPVLVAMVALLALPARAEIYAGTALVDITPSAGVRTVGYLAAEPTSGVQDPITARILVLKSGKTSVAMVVWDLCISISPWLHAKIAELGIDQLLLLSTQTRTAAASVLLRLAVEARTGREPWKAEVAPSGDPACTRGTWRLFPDAPSNEGQSTQGRYLTVWKHQVDGAWKSVVQLSPPSSPDVITRIRAPVPPAPTP